jgi:hypothetical protein
MWASVHFTTKSSVWPLAMPGERGGRCPPYRVFCGLGGFRTLFLHPVRALDDSSDEMNRRPPRRLERLSALRPSRPPRRWLPAANLQHAAAGLDAAEKCVTPLFATGRYLSLTLEVMDAITLEAMLNSASRLVIPCRRAIQGKSV